MNYQESLEILGLIKQSERILVGCHRHADPDSIGSALAMNSVLKKFGKKVLTVCPTETEPYMNYLDGYSEIKLIDFKSFKFSDFDLFLCLDSSSMDVVSDIKEIDFLDVIIVNIDHHKSNKKYGKINLVDSKSASCGEIIYKILSDWQVEIDKNIANSLMAAIVSDTGGFRFPAVTTETFNIATELIKKGADKDQAVLNLLSSFEYQTVKFWGLMLDMLQFDKKNKFVWVAVNNQQYTQAGSPFDGKETAATMFGQLVKGTDFSIFMVESELGVLSISFRSRSGFDTSRIAVELGGGGHIYAAGAKIEGLSFREAVEKVLQVARKYAKK